MMVRLNKIEEAAQLMDDGHAEEAILLLEKILKNASDDDLFMIFELYYEWGHYEKATPLLEKLLKKYPNEGQLIVLLAEMYIELEQDNRAVELLNEIEQDDAFYLDALLHLADLYQAQGLFEVSEQKLFEAKNIAPDELVIDFALAELLFSIGQPNRAIPFYEKIANISSEFNHVSILERLAESHASLGHYEEALDLFTKIDTDHPNMLFKYGLTAYQYDRNDIAIHVWKKLLDADPHYLTVYQELARAMKEEGLLQDAYNIAEKGISFDEYNKELFLIAGELAFELRKDQEGITYVHKAIQLDQDYKEAVLLLINYYKTKDKTDEIIGLLTGIQEVGGNDPLYDWELARAYYGIERYELALPAYQTASEHLLHDSEFLKEYGYFLIEEGLLTEAIHIFHTYLEIEPLDSDVGAFLERLNDTNQK